MCRCFFRCLTSLLLEPPSFGYSSRCHPLPSSLFFCTLCPEGEAVLIDVTPTYFHLRPIPQLLDSDCLLDCTIGKSQRYFKFYISFFPPFFWPCCATCGILVPRPGFEPVPPAVEVQSPNHWTAREFPSFTLLKWNSVPLPHKNLASLSQFSFTWVVSLLIFPVTFRCYLYVESLLVLPWYLPICPPFYSYCIIMVSLCLFPPSA